MQRRAAHIAGLLELRASGEKMLASERSQSSTSKVFYPTSFKHTTTSLICFSGLKTSLGSGFSQEILAFLKFAVEKFCKEEQEVNKLARNVMMSLEAKIKEVNGF